MASDGAADGTERWPGRWDRYECEECRWKKVTNDRHDECPCCGGELDVATDVNPEVYL